MVADGGRMEIDMSLSVHNVIYKDLKSLSVELEFTVACCRVEGSELIKLNLGNEDAAAKFHSSATKLLKMMKRDGVIQLFLFENELKSQDKMEAVYLLNKFPFLADIEILSENSIYVKL